MKKLLLLFSLLISFNGLSQKIYLYHDIIDVDAEDAEEVTELVTH